jgi:hypothetical protein
MGEVPIIETHGEGSSARVYSLDYRTQGVSTTMMSKAAGRISEFFHTVLLPEGYPESVSSDYLSFQIWDSVQGLSSYLRGTLCTQAMLVGVGVGKEGASATSAALQWVLRDGFGMMGGVLFAWWGASYFGVNIRKWRLFADIINDGNHHTINISLACAVFIYRQVFHALVCW